MTQDLHVKYRPKDFSEIIGQDAIITALESYNGKYPHSILFTGAAGCGKTTLSRIIAKKLGADISNVVEIDAASNNGIDNIRALQSGLQYSSFGKSPIKVFILDEAHRITGNAWDALLKTLEEPPSHVYFFLCTTEIDKIPNTIKSRCVVFNVLELSIDSIFEYLAIICELEEFKLSDKILYKIAEASNGSLRFALTNLSKCRAVKSIQEALTLLELPDEASDEIIELCRALYRGTTFTEIQALLKKVDVKNAEGIRLIILAYFSKVLLSCKEKDAGRYLAILDAFGKPYYQAEKLAPLLLSFGTLLLGE